MEKLNEEDLLSAAQVSREVDQRIYRTVRYAPYLAKIIYLVAAAVIALVVRVAFWISSVDTRFDNQVEKYTQLEKRLATNEAKADATQNTINAYITGNDKAVTTQNNLLTNMQKELEDRKPLNDEVRELWFMKEHGISNKEDFVQKHGYQAPSNEAPPFKP